MGKKKNCWEIKNCGREVGGINVVELGVCPASDSKEHTGRNSGENGGRYCWRLAGTFCGGSVQGMMGDKIMDCIECEFLQKVKAEEGLLFTI